MTPLHLAPNITLLHGDCLEFMATLADGAYSLAVVDVPYGIGIMHAGGKGGESTWKGHERKDWDNATPDARYFLELLRTSRNQIIWGANHFPQFLPPSMGWIVWDKLNDKFSTSDGELAYTSFDKALRFFRRHTGTDKGFMNKDGGNIHPCEKPVALYRWLLQNYARPGDTILDTHLGSGSSAIAAWEMGYTFTGIEIDKDYFDAAVERIKKRMSQPYLPGIVQPKPEQTSLF